MNLMFSDSRSDLAPPAINVRRKSYNVESISDSIKPVDCNQYKYNRSSVREINVLDASHETLWLLY